MAMMKTEIHCPLKLTHHVKAVAGKIPCNSFYIMIILLDKFQIRYIRCPFNTPVILSAFSICFKFSILPPKLLPNFRMIWQVPARAVNPLILLAFPEHIYGHAILIL